MLLKTLKVLGVFLTFFDVGIENKGSGTAALKRGQSKMALS